MPGSISSLIPVDFSFLLSEAYIKLIAAYTELHINIIAMVFVNHKTEMAELASFPDLPRFVFFLFFGLLSIIIHRSGIKSSKKWEIPGNSYMKPKNKNRRVLGMRLLLHSLHIT